MTTRKNILRSVSPALVTFVAIFGSLAVFALIVIAPFVRESSSDCAPRTERGGFVQVDGQCSGHGQVGGFGRTATGSRMVSRTR